MRIDVIAPLEAAFQLDVTDDERWYREVARAFAPIVSDGLGTFGWTSRWNDGRAELRAFSELDLDPSHCQMIVGLHGEVSAAEYAQLYRRGAISSLALTVGPETFRRSSLVQRWIHQGGIRDAGGLHLNFGRDSFIAGAVLREPGVLPVATLRWGKPLAKRLLDALRLRAALQTGTPEPAAVFTPGGRIEHAAGDETPRERLRRTVLARERARTKLRHRDPDEALSLFVGLVDGRYTLVDRFDAHGRRHLVAYENPAVDPSTRRLTGREREVFLRVARGHSIKRIACDLGLTFGAAGAYFARAREKTGIRTRDELIRWFRDAAERLGEDEG